MFVAVVSYHFWVSFYLFLPGATSLVSKEREQNIIVLLIVLIVIKSETATAGVLYVGVSFLIKL